MGIQWFRLRPTFELQLNESREQAMEKMRALHDELEYDPTFFMRGEYGELHLPTEEHRLWSPHLSFYIASEHSPAGSWHVETPSTPSVAASPNDPTASTNTPVAEARSDSSRMLGRFAPRIEVWTFVWIVYLAMSFSAFFGLVLAYSQWMLNETTWGNWVAVASVLVIIALYIIAHVGQQWSDDQMHQLRSRLDTLLEQASVPTTPTQP